VPPVLTTASRLDGANPQALEHDSLLLVSIILFATAAELVAEIVVIRVARSSLLRVNTFLSSLRIFT
jgi:hypothetical protein